MVAKVIQPPCAFEGCNRPQNCKGYCKAHYTQMSRGQELQALTETISRVCKIDGCGKPVKAIRRQLCDSHYTRWQRGTLDGLGPKPRSCAVCEKTFTPIRRVNTRYCSNECAITASRWRRQYGLTGEDVNALLRRQDFKCAICADDIDRSSFQIDHNHETGIVRELLCGPCNRGIGHFKDDPIRLLAAADYLFKHLKS